MALVCGALATTVAFAVVPLAHESAMPTFAGARDESDWPLAPGHEHEQRDDALRRAKVFTATNPANTNFRANPPDPSGLLSPAAGDLVRCRYLPGAPRATTPKFDCVLPDGEVIKVKYGRMTAEIQAEVAASRLLTALGFGADRMYLLPRLRCFGCPRLPFETARVLDAVGARDAALRWLPVDRYVDFEWVAVERHFLGPEIAAGDRTEIPKGWAWFELDRVDPAAGGATRAELDALRLAAIFLVHWDNKASNQRLVCRDAVDRGSSKPCSRPFALMHDVGATFGPNKLDVDHWRETRVWTNPAECWVTMRTLPFSGGTFPDTQISEDGRALAARQFSALSSQQITDLFDAARFGSYRDWTLQGTSTTEWAEAFRAKVEEITSAGPCPSPVRDMRNNSVTGDRNDPLDPRHRASDGG